MSHGQALEPHGGSKDKSSQVRTAVSDWSMDRVLSDSRLLLIQTLCTVYILVSIKTENR